jgi:hypothetical protein
MGTTTASLMKDFGLCATMFLCGRNSESRTGLRTNSSTSGLLRLSWPKLCPDPIILIQDYHFSLLRMIRERLPNATFGTFLGRTLRLLAFVH